MSTFIRSLYMGFVTLIVVSALAVGTVTVYPTTVVAAQVCDLPGPCGDCNQRCQQAGFPFGGECQEVDDCCLCFH